MPGPENPEDPTTPVAQPQKSAFNEHIRKFTGKSYAVLGQATGFFKWEADKNDHEKTPWFKVSTGKELAYKGVCTLSAPFANFLLVAETLILSSLMFVKAILFDTLTFDFKTAGDSLKISGIALAGMAYFAFMTATSWLANLVDFCGSLISTACHKKEPEEVPPPQPA